MVLKPGKSSQWISWRRKALAAIKRVTTQPLRRGIKDHFNNALRTSARLRFMEERLADNEVLLEQVLTIVHRESNIPLLPPKHLQIRVVGNYGPDFIESGFSGIYPSLNRTLKYLGKELKDFELILDFGCGCGRAIRALAGLVPASKLFGTDIDREAIEWLQRNYSKFGEFSVTPHTPPTPYEDKRFDLVFGISVFTHLPEDLQFLWLRELARIIKPGGYAIVTTLGESFHKVLDSNALKILEQDGFYYSDFGFNYGKSISLPDFYQTAFHSHEYIRKEWNQFFDVIDIQALGFENYQDTVLLQSRPFGMEL